MGTNSVGKALKVLGIIIMIIGIIVSIILAANFPILQARSWGGVREVFNTPYLLLGMFMSVVSGMFFIGIAEIIQLLQRILDNGEEQTSKHTDKVFTDELPDL